MINHESEDAVEAERKRKEKDFLDCIQKLPFSLHVCGPFFLVQPNCFPRLPVMFFHPLVALSTVFCFGELVVDPGSIDSHVGGVVGGVIGFAYDPGDDVPESSIRLSPEPQELGAEFRCHPKLALKGDAAR
jgi:hypothetical protein